MAYVNMSVDNIESSQEFYVEHIGLFESIAPGRIKQINGNSIIIDFVEIDSDKHLDVFNKKEHVVMSFMISAPENISHTTIGNNLKKSNIEFGESFVQHEHRVHVTDPTGNKITIACSAMAFQFE